MSKYLIGGNFKALRSGEFVEASEGSEEFIFDSSNTEEHTAATIVEIAKANGLTLPGKTNKKDAIVLLAKHLDSLKLPEVNKMTDTQTVEKIIAEGVANGKTDDDMLIEIIGAGVSFKAAGKLFKTIMEDKGYRVSAKVRAEKANKILVDSDFGGAGDVTAELVAATIAQIVADIPDTSEKQALVAIRKYAKEKEIAMPKSSKGKGGGGSILDKACDWLKSNLSATEDEIFDEIKRIKPDITDGMLKAYASHVVRTQKFAKSIS